MSRGVLRFERKSIEWVLSRTGSCFARVIERRLAAGEQATARIFSVQGDRFAQVQFANLALAELVLPLGRAR